MVLSSVLLLVVVAAASETVSRRVQTGFHAVLLAQLSHCFVHNVALSCVHFTFLLRPHALFE